MTLFVIIQTLKLHQLTLATPLFFASNHNYHPSFIFCKVPRKITGISGRQWRWVNRAKCRRWISKEELWI